MALQELSQYHRVEWRTHFFSSRGSFCWSSWMEWSSGCWRTRSTDLSLYLNLLKAEPYCIEWPVHNDSQHSRVDDPLMVGWWPEPIGVKIDQLILSQHTGKQSHSLSIDRHGQIDINETRSRHSLRTLEGSCPAPNFPYMGIKMFRAFTGNW